MNDLQLSSEERFCGKETFFVKNETEFTEMKIQFKDE